MEILAPERYAELEEFVARHPRGEFMQSPRWRLVKENWDYAAVVSRDAEGAIKGSMGVLIRKIPALHTALLYAPRGPICDVHDWETIADLKAGVDQLAKQVHAHEFKMDPDIPMADGEFIAEMKKLGFVHSYGPDGFEGSRRASTTGSIWRGGTRPPCWPTVPRECAGTSARRKRLAWR